MYNSSGVAMMQKNLKVAHKNMQRGYDNSTSDQKHTTKHVMEFGLGVGVVGGAGWLLYQRGKTAEEVAEKMSKLRGGL